MLNFVLLSEDTAIRSYFSIFLRQMVVDIHSSTLRIFRLSHFMLTIQ